MSRTARNLLAERVYLPKIAGSAGHTLFGVSRRQPHSADIAAAKSLGHHEADCRRFSLGRAATQRRDDRRRMTRPLLFVGGLSFVMLPIAAAADRPPTISPSCARKSKRKLLRSKSKKQNFSNSLSISIARANCSIARANCSTHSCACCGLLAPGAPKRPHRGAEHRAHQQRSRVRRHRVPRRQQQEVRSLRHPRRRRCPLHPPPVSPHRHPRAAKPRRSRAPRQHSNRRGKLSKRPRRCRAPVGC